MPLPLAGLIAGLVGRALVGIAGSGAGVAASGSGRFLAGMLGRAAIGSGTSGAAARLGLAAATMMKGRLVNPPKGQQGPPQFVRGPGAVPTEIMGALAKDFGTLSKSVASLPAELDSWATRLKDSAASLAQFNGVIGASVVQFERDEIRRMMASGRATSGSTSEMLKSASALKDEIRPIKDALTNLGNYVSSIASNLAAKILSGSGLPTLLGGEPKQGGPAENTQWQELLSTFGARGRTRFAPPMGDDDK